MDVNLMEELPPLYDDNVTMNELQSILSDKINTADTDTDAAVDECFIMTASKLLARYENIYGIPTDVTKSDEFRREILNAKDAGEGTVNNQLMIDTAASYSNGIVDIIKNPTDCSFIVKFVGTLGIPANMDGLTNTINEIKPAHLAFSFEYTYITWDDFEKYNHTCDEWDAKNLTWDELEAYKE